ncbi:hypothetical protein GWI33_023327 [Rhynchophorus ferrugineus]|uniref:Uncharacterized protein n=1 Tax=Rhynchophorus ferrugineus TaxID=354439 RepID=A0A834HMI6_RHYFE|nr:hypothetical protein GWI33_023327 [Rhynchophorus ferrugineus]
MATRPQQDRHRSSSADVNKTRCVLFKGVGFDDFPLSPLGLSPKPLAPRRDAGVSRPGRPTSRELLSFCYGGFVFESCRSLRNDQVESGRDYR